MQLCLFSKKPFSSYVKSISGLDIRPDLIDGHCLPVEYEIPAKETSTEYGSDYDIMIRK